MASGVGENFKTFANASDRRQTKRPVRGEATNGGNLRFGESGAAILQRELRLAENWGAGEEHQVQEPRLRHSGQQALRRRHLPGETGGF